jgi:hypothetical protein
MTRLNVPGCLLRWLLPDSDNKWILGPDEERPIELSCLTPVGPPPAYLEAIDYVPFEETDQWNQLRFDNVR